MFYRVVFTAVVMVLTGVSGPDCYSQDFDVGKIIRIHTPEDVRSIRADFTRVLFGETGLPCEKLPDTVEHEIISYLTPSSGHPVRYFLDPVVCVVNYMQQFDFDRISMVGISGGGWTVTLCAALDTRIEYSFPVAGSHPMYLRFSDEDLSSLGDYEQYVPEIYRMANYLELYILGACGVDRKQVQILNEFDDCCFDGTGYRSYENIVAERVRQLGQGSFRVILDSTHRGHMISVPMIEEIIKVLKSDDS